MKKGIIIVAVIVIVAFGLLFPFETKSDEHGCKRTTAVLYSISSSVIENEDGSTTEKSGFSIPGFTEFGKDLHSDDNVSGIDDELDY